MRTVLLFLLYYLIVTPIGRVCRLVRDPLHREWNPDAASYWIPAAHGARVRTWRGQS
jgi:hypothetical protein